MTLQRLACCLLPAFCSLSAVAESSTLVQQVLGQASAPLHTTLPSGAGFSTGPRSKSELNLQGGVARVGEQTAVETTPRGLTLRRGLTLVASDPGRLRKNIEVKAPGYRLQVKGTVQVAFDPGRSLKLVVLEGTATVSLDSLMGEFETLRPGQMLVINPSDRRLPEPVEIDVQRLVATSSLTGGGLGPLATSGNIKNSTGAQAAGLARGELQATPLLLRGLNNELEIENRRLATAVAPATVRRLQEPTELAVFHLRDDLQDPAAVTVQQTYRFPDSSTTNSLEDVVLRHNKDNISRTHTLEVELTPHLDFSNFPDINKDVDPQIKGKVTVDPSFFAADPKTFLFTFRDEDDHFARVQVNPDAIVHSPTGTNLRFDVKWGMDVTGAMLTAGASDFESLELNATNRGLNIVGSALRGGRVSLHGGENPAQILIARRITDDGPQISTIVSNRTLQVGQAGSPTGITITNSSQLRSLAENVVLRSKRADIQLTAGALLQAPNGNIIIDADGSSATDPTPGRITVSDAQLGARSIRLHGFSNSGEALIIDKSTLKAGRYIELFADGASTLLFRGEVNLHSPRVVLRGQRVEVALNGNVTISGKGKVYTNDAQYNIPTKGNIKDKYGPVAAKGYDEFKR